jgi:dTDP-glucose 4,6-dehydratase
MPRKYLVTGGAGFIGSNFIRRLFASEPAATVTNLDALTYAGVQQTVDELDTDPRHTFVRGDIRDADLVDGLMPGHDVVVHFAADSHVDRSIDDQTEFLGTNVIGTGVLLDAARRQGVPRFIHVSTDEVYGSVDDGFASEESRLHPSSPYSASKAASDLLVGSYAVTYGYKAIVGRCTNNFGPYQYPEKVIPLFVTNLLDDRRVPLYGEGLNERDWLFVGDHCAALHLLVDEGTPGETYNIGAGNQVTNLELTHRILHAMGRDESVIDRVADRPGHDLRYAVDAGKIRALGWRPERPFEEDLTATIEWYRSHEDWWRPLKGTPT